MLVTDAELQVLKIVISSLDAHAGPPPAVDTVGGMPACMRPLHTHVLACNAA